MAEYYGSQYDDTILINTGGTGSVTYGGSTKGRKLAKKTFEDSLAANYLNFAYAGDGNDKVYGGSDNDAVDGGNGDDQVYGGGGNDLLVGGNGKDTVYGGSGDDMIGATATTGATSDNGMDKLVGDGFDPVIDKDGKTTSTIGPALTTWGKDTIVGGNAKDEIWGDNEGDDKNGADDMLFGANGDDTIHGGGGNDEIEGENGADQLWGGEGNDVFGYGSVAESNAAGYDTIWDFDGFKDVDPWGDGTDDRDRIDVNEIESALGIDFTWLGKNSGFLLGGTAGINGAWYSWVGDGTLTKDDDFTFVYGDTDKDGDADLVIRLKGLHSLVAGDLDGVNHAPTSTDDSVSTNEDTAVVLGLSDFGTFADIDPGDTLAAVKITTLESDGSLEYLSGVTWVAVTLNQVISAADITAGKLRFVPASNENGSPYATIGFQVSDGTDFSAAAYILTVNVNAVNDAPVNTIGAQVATEDTASAITGLQVSDVDAGSADITVTLSVANGTLTVLAGVVGGLAAGDIAGNGTGSVTLTGTVAEINATLAAVGGVSYLGNLDFNGTDSLTMVSNDGGATGADPGLTDGPGAEEDSDTVNIAVAAVNDAPVNGIVLPAGVLDTTFSGDGKATVSINPQDFGTKIAIQSDGKIVQIGSTYSGGFADFGVVRYNRDGSLDTSFDGDGKVVTPVLGSHDVPTSVALQADGKILVGGYAQSGSYDFALVRYNSDGSLDTSFDGDGKVTTAIGTGDDQSYGMAVQSDGKIVLAGFATTSGNRDFALVRYNANGSLDTSFDIDGKVTTAIGTGEDIANAVAIQADGKIVVVGQSHNGANNDIALVRYNADGSLDTTFDTDGKLITAIGSGDDIASAVAIQADGKIVVAGWSWNGASNDFALVRYNTDGSLDTSFGGDGIVTTDIGGSLDIALSIAIQPDGKIVVAGTSVNGTYQDFAVARYNSDGSLDTSFDGDGTLLFGFGSNHDQAGGVGLQADGSIVVGGWTTSDGGGNFDFAVATVSPGGLLTVSEDTPKAITGLSISDVDAGSGSVTVTLSVLHGTLVVSGGSAGISGSGTGTVTLTGTVAAINSTLAASVIYTPATDYNGSDALTMTTNDNGNTGLDPLLTDGPGAEEDSDTIAITVVAVNDAPVIDVDGAATYTTGGPVVAIDSTITITDVDNTTLTGAVISITGSFQSGDSLNFVNQLGITGSYNAITGVLALSGSASLAAYETAIESITFSTTAGSTATRTISYTVNDGAANSATDTATVNVVIGNSAPTDITLTAAVSLGWQLNVGTFTGQLSATDPNIGDTFTFGLESGSSSGFSISGSTLTGTLAQSQTYTLNLKVTDQGSLSYTETINIITGSNGSGDTLPTGGTGDGGEDILFGNNQNDILYGGSGNDQLFGGGGNDTFNGDDGDDALIAFENTSNSTSTLIAVDNFIAANGGLGIDTFRFGDGVGVRSLDLDGATNELANLDSIEAIDMTDGGADDVLLLDSTRLNAIGSSAENSNITLTVLDVLGSLGGAFDDDQIDLFVRGDANDDVDISETWTSLGTATINSVSYSLYAIDVAATTDDAVMAVQTGVTLV